MLGWRAKIGLVIPSNNTVIEPELWAMVPAGVTVHAARILTHGSTPEGITEMEKAADRAVRELQAGTMSVVAYACLATSLVKGLDWTRAIADHIEQLPGCRSATAATATFGAVRAMRARRVALATPYPDRINALVPSFVEACGLAVAGIRNLNVQDSTTLWRVPPETVIDLARSVDTADADAVCILATDLPTITVINTLEAELGKPVITTNQAILWKCLMAAGINEPIPGRGRLLRDMPGGVGA